MARAGAWAMMLVACAFVAAGCGGGNKAAAAADGEVVLGFTTDRDPSGLLPTFVRECNEQAKGRYRIQEIIMPPSADAKREQLVRRLAGKDTAMDILSLDVIWTAEFSEAGWILDLTEQMEPMKHRWVPAALATAQHNGKYWAYPTITNTAMLYYRTDLVETPPKTWEEMARIAKEVQQQNPELAGFVWQGAQYEGLTVNALEYIHAANGAVLSEDGRNAVLDQGDSALHALKFMRSLVDEGISPKVVSTFREEEGRQMFQQGRAVFLRNWPYVYSLATEAPDTKVKGKFDVVPLPEFEGRTTASVLGGMNMAISRHSQHPELAWEAIQCLSNEQNGVRRLLTKGDLPAFEEGYENADVTAKIPWIATARKALDKAHPRPVSPYYNDITYAINKNANDVIAGRATAEEGLAKMQHGVQLAIEGNGEI